MTKKEHIAYWITNADKDWQRAERCFRDQDYVFSLFCLHLAMEKICKALWVKYNEENFPPKIHNLVRLLKGSSIELEEEKLIFLNDLNKFQLESRYSDYREKIYKECTTDFTKNMFKKAKTIKLCLIKKLQ